MTFWLNGEFRGDTNAIDIADRGFLIGDGVFETMLIADGALAFLAVHLARLRCGAAALGVSADFSDAEIAQAAAGLAARNGLEGRTGASRLTLTRGTGPRGLAIGDGPWTPTLLLTAGAYDPPQGAAALIVSAHRRNERSAASRWKTLNYIDNMLARQEAAKAGADDAIMLNMAGRAACASVANVFLVSGDGAATPPVSEGAMPGIVRATLLKEAAAAGVAIAERPIEESELRGAAIFLTNSLWGLRAASLGGAAMSAAAADVFAALKSCYAAAMKRDLATKPQP